MLLDTRTESKRYVSIVSEGCCSQLCGATLRASTLPGLLMQTQPIFFWIVDSAIINTRRKRQGANTGRVCVSLSRADCPTATQRSRAIRRMIYTETVRHIIRYASLVCGKESLEQRSSTPPSTNLTASPSSQAHLKITHMSLPGSW